MAGQEFAHAGRAKGFARCLSYQSSQAVRHIKHLSILLLLLLTACDKQAKLDAAKLESLLSDAQIDRVEVVVPFSRTNVLTGATARQYVLSLRETNRIAEPDRTKAQVVTEVALMRGTNEVGWLSQFDNGLWKYEDYSFRLRTLP